MSGLNFLTLPSPSPCHLHQQRRPASSRPNVLEGRAAVLYCLGSTWQVAGPCPNVRVVPSFTKRAGSTSLVRERPRASRPHPRGGEVERKGLRGQELGARARARPPPPRGHSPPALTRRKSRGHTPPGRSETRAGAREGRRGGAWPARRGRALGGGAAARRSRLWGLGFAALAALGRELERGPELGSQRSHRDERRSRRLGFSLRSALPAPRPDRWVTAAGTPTVRLLGEACAREGGTRRSASGERTAGPQCPCVPVSGGDSRCPSDSPAPCLAHLREETPAASGGFFGNGDSEGRLGVSEVAGCVRVWGGFCAEVARGAEARGSGVPTERLLWPCEARPQLPFVKSWRVCDRCPGGPACRFSAARRAKLESPFSPLRLLPSNRRRSLCPELGTDPLPPLLTAPPVETNRSLRISPPPG